MMPRNALHRFGPLALLLGHDVGVGMGVLGAQTVIVGRAWGFAVGPVALFWTKNVTREALQLRPRDWQKALDDDPLE